MKLKLGLVLLVSLFSTNAFGQVEAFLGVDTWKVESVKGHPILMVRGTFDLEAAKLIAELNTDTLTFRGEKQFGSWSLGLQARGELFIAGLLIDYYQNGILIEENGFYASYVSGQIDAKNNLGDNWFTVSLGVRQWFFRANDNTQEAFDFPDDALVFEPRLSWTYWKIAPDPSFYEAHRIGRRRIKGFGIGADLGLDYRDQASEWGAPGDTRNRPESLILTARQWAAFGWEWRPGWRLQLKEWAGYGHGEDDITRQRIGGQNPYVVTVPGVPWASFLASRYVAGELSQAMRLTGDIELGFTANAALVEDPNRIGNFDEFGELVGASIFADARWGDWQFNLAVGASPNTGFFDRDLLLGAWVDVGVKF